MVWKYRSDGDYVKNVPHMRRIQPFIMRTRTESAVYFEQSIHVGPAFDFLNQFHERTGQKATLLHLVILAAARVLHERPRLNRFTSGGRLYQRRGIWVSFSAKRAKSDNAPVFVVKRQIDPETSLTQLLENINPGVNDGRQGKQSKTDKELSLFFMLPHIVLSFFSWLVLKMDQWGLLPQFFIQDDPLFSSIFIANLGSIQMDSGFHHLFEYGNTSIFLTIGQAKKEYTLDADGNVQEKLLASFKYAFDERVEDGLYAAQSLARLQHFIENPQELTGIPE